MKISPQIRIGLTLLGALLLVGAFLGNLYLGAINNPPPLRIVVASRDLQSGDRLQSSDLAVEDQVINPSLSRLYVQEAEIKDYLNAFVVDPMRRGDPLNKVKFASAAGSSGRYGLVLTDTSQVVMVLPVSPDLIPSKIKSGDFINILFAAGEGNLNKMPMNNQVGAEIAVPTTIADPKFKSVAGLEMTMSISVPHPVDLPLADVLLEHVEILDVNFQQVQNPNYSTDTGRTEQPWLSGAISSVVVRVPRSYQTLLSFASANGKVRYAISSPLLDASQMSPQAGVDWGKIVELYRWKDQQAFDRGETLTQTLYPGYVARQAAALNASAVMTADVAAAANAPLAKPALDAPAAAAVPTDIPAAPAAPAP